MFRGTGNSKPNKEYFGVGSFIIIINDKWLVVNDGADCVGSIVRLLNLKTFQMEGEGIHAEDMNYLSYNEANKLLSTIKGKEHKNTTTSDYTFQSEGMK